MGSHVRYGGSFVYPLGCLGDIGEVHAFMLSPMYFFMTAGSDVSFVRGIDSWLLRFFRMRSLLGLFLICLLDSLSTASEKLMDYAMYVIVLSKGTVR